MCSPSPERCVGSSPVAPEHANSRRCRRGTVVEHVEVKGVSGTEEAFVMTHGEVRCAQWDPAFVLYVVMQALSDAPQLARYTGAEFLTGYDLSALQYRATRR